MYQEPAGGDRTCSRCGLEGRLACIIGYVQVGYYCDTCRAWLEKMIAKFNGETIGDRSGTDPG